MLAIAGEEIIVNANFLKAQEVSGFNFIDDPQRVTEPSLAASHSVAHAKGATGRAAAAGENAGRDVHR